MGVNAVIVPSKAAQLFPLSYDEMREQEGVYEIHGYPDRRLVVFGDKLYHVGETGEFVRLQDHMMASGWGCGTFHFRRASDQVVVTFS